MRFSFKCGSTSVEWISSCLRLCRSSDLDSPTPRRFDIPHGLRRERVRSSTNGTTRRLKLERQGAEPYFRPVLGGAVRKNRRASMPITIRRFGAVHRRDAGPDRLGLRRPWFLQRAASRHAVAWTQPNSQRSSLRLGPLPIRPNAAALFKVDDHGVESSREVEISTEGRT